MTNAPLAPFADAPPRVQKLIIGLAVTVSAAAGLGLLLLPLLSVKHPMVLLALAPGYLGLVAGRVDFAPAYLLVVSRRLLTMSAFYGISGLYGEATLRSLTAGSPRVERVVRWVSARFRRFGTAFLILTPAVAVPMSMIAGVSGMRLRPFLLGAALGQLIWTAVTYRFGIAISVFTERALRFAERNLLLVSVVVAVLVTVQQVVSRRRARARGARPIV